MREKECSQCYQIRPLSHFLRKFDKRWGKKGVRSECMLCARVLCANYRARVKLGLPTQLIPYQVAELWDSKRRCDLTGVSLDIPNVYIVHKVHLGRGGTHTLDNIFFTSKGWRYKATADVPFEVLKELARMPSGYGALCRICMEIKPMHEIVASHTRPNMLKRLCKSCSIARQNTPERRAWSKRYHRERYLAEKAKRKAKGG